jgi:hypothetical protein
MFYALLYGGAHEESRDRSSFPIGLNSIAGSSYFFSKDMAANIEFGIRGSQFGALFKF